MPATKGISIDRDWLRERNWWQNVAVGQLDECWPWKKSAGSHKYGQTWDGQHVLLAHRVALTLWLDEDLPKDMTVDHECRNRLCCNPLHLRLLTNYDNAKDNGQSRKTNCPKGHPYDEANTYIQPSNGSRRCRTCSKKN